MPCGVVVYACFFFLGVICMYLVVASVWYGWSLSSVCSWLLVISRCSLWSVGLLATWSSVGSLLVSGCVMVAYLLLLVLALLVWFRVSQCVGVCLFGLVDPDWYCWSYLSSCFCSHSLKILVHV